MKTIKNLDWKNIDSKLIWQNQIVRASIAIIVFVGLAVFVMKGSKKQANIDAQQANESTKIMSPTDVLNTDSMSKKYLEERIDATGSKNKQEIKGLEDSLEEYKKQLKEELAAEITGQKSQLLRELAEAREENQKIQQQLKFIQAGIEDGMNVRELQVQKRVINKAGPSINIINVSKHKTIGFKIPANRFASGTLEHGADVSTASSSSSNPKPFKVHIDSAGNLPAGFLEQYEDCSITTASVGGLSDERAEIRLESMTCRHKKTKEEIETDVAGYITDESGKVGIRGIMADRSLKLIQNSFVGGVIGGIANIGRKNNSISLPFGGVANTGQNKFTGRLQDGLLGGAEQSSSILSKYYIDFAEKIHPIIQIEPGRRVDIHFTKTVHLGERGVQQKIQNEREKNLNEFNEQ